jgi:predicted nucleotidyltransferase
MVIAPDSTVTANSLREKAQPVIAEATRRLVAEFHPEQVWLFGSYAWGDPTEDSDLDLMVVVPESSERPLKRMQRAQRCLRGVQMARDVLVSTSESARRFAGIPSSLTYKIFHEGVKLHG